MKCSLIFTMLFWSLAYSLFFYVLGCSSNWRFTVWPDSRSLQRNSAGMIINSLNVSSKGGGPKSNFEKVEDVAAFQVLLRQGRSIISQENICANKIQPAMWMYVSSWAIFLQLVIVNFLFRPAQTMKASPIAPNQKLPHWCLSLRYSQHFTVHMGW